MIPSSEVRRARNTARKLSVLLTRARDELGKMSAATSYPPSDLEPNMTPFWHEAHSTLTRNLHRMDRIEQDLLRLSKLYMPALRKAAK